MKNQNSIEYLEKKLNRFEIHLKKLKVDHSYNNFEEKRKSLANYYEENISRLQTRIEKHQLIK